MIASVDVAKLIPFALLGKELAQLRFTNGNRLYLRSYVHTQGLYLRATCGGKKSSAFAKLISWNAAQQMEDGAIDAIKAEILSELCAKNNLGLDGTNR